MIESNFSLNNQQNETKKLISHLLKKYLGDNIGKLEQKNAIDENIINSIKQTSNNMKNFLEYTSEKSKYYFILNLENLYSYKKT